MVDDLVGKVGRGLDVGQPAQRAQAVRATIGASTSLLERHDADRFAELAVFAEDETISFSLVSRLWRVTAGLDDLQAAQVCNRIARLALVSLAADQGINLHDVGAQTLCAQRSGNSGWPPYPTSFWRRWPLACLRRAYWIPLI